MSKTQGDPRASDVEFSPFRFDACACGQLRMASRVITQFYDETLRPAGLRVTQYGVLVALRFLGPVTVTRLAEVTHTDRTTLTRNLALLRRKGWVRIVAGQDRREREVSLTDDGRDTLRAARPYWEQAQRTVAERLGEERLQRLLGDLNQTVDVTRTL